MSLDTVKTQLEAAQELIAQALGEVVVLSTPPYIRVRKGDSLQAAVDAAKPGDKILVYPDVYPSLVLPDKGQGTSITIAPDTTALGAGVRVNPSHASAMISLKSPNELSPLRTSGKASNWVLRGFRPMYAYDGRTPFVNTGDGHLAVEPSGLPDNLVLDQFLLEGLSPMGTGAKVAVRLNCNSIKVLNSHMQDFAIAGQDSQCMGGYAGPGGFHLENNYLSAASENVIFGGADNKSVAMIPSNLVLRGNLLTKPMVWKTTPLGVVKNGFELKSMLNALVENNIIENSWMHGQVGFLVLFTPRNQDGGSPWTQVANVVFQYNVVRNGAGGISILGYDDIYESRQTTNIKVVNNLFYDIVQPGAQRMFQVGNTVKDVTIAHNTCLTDEHNSGATFLTLWKGPKGLNEMSMTDNILPEGEYGMHGSDAPGLGRAAWDYCCTGSLEGNLIGCGTSGRNINYGGTNTKSDAGEYVVGADYKPTAKYSSHVTTDGMPVGCDITELRKRVSF